MGRIKREIGRFLAGTLHLFAYSRKNVQIAVVLIPYGAKFGIVNTSPLLPARPARATRTGATQNPLDQGCIVEQSELLIDTLHGG
jgi:hypothetical protein